MEDKKRVEIKVSVNGVGMGYMFGFSIGMLICILSQSIIQRRQKLMDKYVCKENLTIPFEDDDGSITDKFGVAKKDSIWKVSDEIGESDVRLYLVSGESDFSWMDICNETLEASFIRIQESEKYGT